MSDYELNIRLAFMVGIFLTSAIFFLLLYFSLRRKPSLLWISLYCFSHPLKSLFKPYQDLISPELFAPYQTHGVSQFIVIIGGFLLIGFLLWELNLPRKKQWISIYGLYCLAAYFLLSDRVFSDVLIVSGILLSGWGVYQKKKGAGWMLIGMVGYAVLNYLGHADLLGFAYFAGIIFFILCMSVSAGQNVAQEIKKQQEAVLRAKTLENQLLKTSIQPHFVYNSLAALQELIEQDPRKASDFVDKLADEFQLITQSSGKKMIPISEEIILCKMHLKIMEYRKNADFTFSVKGINGDEHVPPGIFHTLVENGMTHGYSQKNTGSFLLSKEVENGHIKYALFNDSEVENNKVVTLGTGLKYVQAAVNEQYGDGASVHWQRDENGWTVEIIIDK